MSKEGLKMYTEKNLSNDIFEVSQEYYVKYNLLREIVFKMYRREPYDELIEAIPPERDIDQVLARLAGICRTIAENNGISKDPVKKARKLRKEKNTRAAYNILAPLIASGTDDQETLETYLWTMYDYLKANEADISKYLKVLKKLNEIADKIRFRLNEYTIVQRCILHSVYRVICKEDKNANILLREFVTLVRDDTFLRVNNKDDGGLARKLVWKFAKNIDAINCLIFMQTLGLLWLSDRDFKSIEYVSAEGKEEKLEPLAVRLCNKYMNRLQELKNTEAIVDFIRSFIKEVDKVEAKCPDIWLTYKKAFLYNKIGEVDKALEIIIVFAKKQNHPNKFIVWNAISKIVTGDDEFNSLCKALLCKDTAPKMVLGVQERLIPLLLERKMFSEAKYELEKLVEVRKKENWHLNQDILELLNSNWYKEYPSASNRDSLKEYGRQAEKILYKNMPARDIFITYINQEKKVINFIFYEDHKYREGYGYVGHLDNIELRANTVYSAKMDLQIVDLSTLLGTGAYKANIFEILMDKKILDNSKYIKQFSGVFDKIGEYGFVRGSHSRNVYIDKSMVASKEIAPFSKISGSASVRINKKSRAVEWSCIEISEIVPQDLSDFEKIVEGQLQITKNGIGFIEDCFLSSDLIQKFNLSDGMYVTAKVRKSWDRKKNHWGWKAYDIVDKSAM